MNRELLKKLNQKYGDSLLFQKILREELKKDQSNSLGMTKLNQPRFPFFPRMSDPSASSFF